MTFSRKKSSYFIIIPLFSILFISCSAQIDGFVRDGGTAEFRLKTALEPRTATLIRSIMNFMSDTGNVNILDGEAIGKSMSSAPGIRSVTLKNTAPAALEGVISLANVGDFLTLTGAGNGAGSGAGGGAGGSAGRSRFITYTGGRTAGSSSIILVLDMNSAPEIIAMLSPDVEEYLSALMAPAVLAETSTKQEYLDLLASIYGRPLANEIYAARIRASIEFPGPVTSVSGGKAAGRMAEFDIPLIDILVLETPLRYEISW